MMRLNQKSSCSHVYVHLCVSGMMPLSGKTARGLKSLFDQAKMKEHLCSFVMISPPTESRNIRIVMRSLATATDSPGSSDQRSSENRYLGQLQLLLSEHLL